MVTVLWWWRRREERDDLREKYGIIGDGSVAEWLKAHDSKSCGRLRVSEVRILSLPPYDLSRDWLFFVVVLVDDGLISCNFS